MLGQLTQVKTIKAPKAFDAVDMMHGIRTKINEETEGMNFPELQRYVKQRLEASNVHPTPLAPIPAQIA